MLVWQKRQHWFVHVLRGLQSLTRCPSPPRLPAAAAGRGEGQDPDGHAACHHAGALRSAALGCADLLHAVMGLSVGHARALQGGVQAR